MTNPSVSAEGSTSDLKVTVAGVAASPVSVSLPAPLSAGKSISVKPSAP